MSKEIAELVKIRTRARDGTAFAVVNACLEFCFRAEIANDDPRKTLLPGEVEQFRSLIGRLRAGT
ncbi:hypothetical protein [Phenylobacterium sp.]|uniref:hypothetical protein n=1 Tax=Phenylobacterium sp. TaxID=1871053 RepID=UPI002B8AACE6|nr:hypothetical protein [Phenylobacterium sp.]HVI33744.1 hypothetical protein [Phenylobacterium sp.]